MNTTSDGLQALNCLIFGILESFVALTSVVFNGLLLVVLYRNPFKSFRRPFSVLIIALVITDFLKGLLPDSVKVWVHIHCAYGKTTWIEESWNFFTVLDYALDNSATLLVTLFAGDRLLAVSMPLFYRNYITVKKITLAVWCVWFYALVFSLLQFTDIPGETYDLVDCLLHIVVPLILMLIVHILIFYTLQKRRKIETMRHEKDRNEIPSWVVKNQKLERNFRVVATVITIVLAVSQLPWLSIVVIKACCKELTNMKWFENYDIFAGFALSLTSAINPVLYCWRLNEYRRALKALVTCNRYMTSTSGDHHTNQNNLHVNQERKDKNTNNEEDFNCQQNFN